MTRREMGGRGGGLMRAGLLLHAVVFERLAIDRALQEEEQRVNEQRTGVLDVEHLHITSSHPINPSHPISTHFEAEERVVPTVR
jgi:hypothetical protein